MTLFLIWLLCFIWSVLFACLIVFVVLLIKELTKGRDDDG